MDALTQCTVGSVLRRGSAFGVSRKPELFSLEGNTLRLREQYSGQRLKPNMARSIRSVRETRRAGETCSVATSDETVAPASEAGGSSSNLPLREIPGGYGVPVLGAIKDRLDFFWFQGLEKFFQSRVDKYKSTVYRVNMPPGPPGFPDSRVIMLLDQSSFPVLFDLSKVEKKDVFTGTYMPSLSYYGGFRLVPWLDPSEERHSKLKQFCFNVLKNNGRRFIPEFSKAINESFTAWENALAKNEQPSFSDELSQFAFNFMVRAIVHRDPVAPGEASLGTNGSSYVTLWTAGQLAPIFPFGLPHIIEELTVHSFRVPYFLVKKQYDTLFNFFKTHATDALDMAEESGLDRDEATHNLLFFIGFNAFGGFNILFPEIIKFLMDSGPELQKELADEVRAAAKANGGLTMKALESMPLVKSVVYESLRLSPPVPYQYARAKIDFILESHDASFHVKKGELLGGYQPFVTRDPKVFDDANKFVPKRFLGREGEKLLRHVFWSNGRETDEPTLANKQCAGKDLVITIANLFVAEMCFRYDEFAVTTSGSGVGTKLAFSSLKKATS